LILATGVTAQDTQTVKRKRAIMRDGPGSFYPVLAELPQGTEFIALETVEGWYKAQAADLEGYISRKVTKEKKGGNNNGQNGLPGSMDVFNFGENSTAPAPVKVSQIGLSAAVKGYAKAYLEHLEGELAFLQEAITYRVNLIEYLRFRQQTYQQVDTKAIQKRMPLPARENSTYFTYSEEGLGLAIATKLAQLGVLQNRAVQDYVNMVGNLVVEASEAYDQGFKFFILDMAAPNAFACPGGYIFVTRGLLQQIRSEAELACVLGHEIAHVSRYHGMKELELNDDRVQAASAFDELDKEGGGWSTEAQAVDQEMKALAQQIYERISSGRLQEYEDEADKLGVWYAVRAGYQPQASLDLLARLAASKFSASNEHYTVEHTIERITMLKEEVTRLKEAGANQTFTERYRKQMAGFR
jgi:hypothetical protein